MRRRYSDFEWLREELERNSKIVVPPLPGKAFKRQLPFRQASVLAVMRVVQMATPVSTGKFGCCYWRLNDIRFDRQVLLLLLFLFK